MKKMLYHLFPALILLALPAVAVADTSVDSTSLIRFFQDSRPNFTVKDFIPATQFLGVDVNKLGDGNLSLHLYGWGRADLADKSYNNDQADGSLTYGYAQYRFNQANGMIRLGRFFINEGIINEQVDGLGAHTDLPLGFELTAFGGATVHTVDMPGERTDGKGDGIAGGRLNYRYAGIFEVGVSGVYESNAPVLTADQPLATGVAFGSHRLLGGDVWLSPHPMVEARGHSSYNTETEEFAEHSYLLNLRPHQDLVLTGEFNDYRDRSVFYSSILFSSLLTNLNDRSRTVGGRATYQLSKTVELSGDFKRYSREIGKSDRFGGDVRFTMLNNSLRTGLGYHYLRSSPEFAIIPTTTSSGSFHQVRGYVLHDTKSYLAALDAIGYFFKQDINSRSNAWEVITSLGYHLTPALTLSGDVSYGMNPQFDDDLKGLIRLTYNATYTGKGGPK